MEEGYTIKVEYLPNKDWIKTTVIYTELVSSYKKKSYKQKEVLTAIDTTGKKPDAEMVIKSSNWKEATWTDLEQPYTEENLETQAQQVTIMSFFEEFYK
jgi:hypothetical protein